MKLPIFFPPFSLFLKVKNFSSHPVFPSDSYPLVKRKYQSKCTSLTLLNAAPTIPAFLRVEDERGPPLPLARNENVTPTSIDTPITACALLLYYLYGDAIP
ncbi:MAG: hypothetical protein ABIM17_05555 [candidate division WOR-3 bacterium]